MIKVAVVILMQKCFHFVGTGQSCTTIDRPINHYNFMSDSNPTTIDRQINHYNFMSDYTDTQTHTHTYKDTHAHSQIQIKYEEYGKWMPITNKMTLIFHVHKFKQLIM